MRPGESTMDILAMLLERADKGVQVQILVDGFSGAIRMEGKALFYVLSSHPNVEIRIYIIGVLLIIPFHVKELRSFFL